MKEKAIKQLELDLNFIINGAVEYDVTPTYYNLKGKLELLVAIGILSINEMLEWEQRVNKEYGKAIMKAEVK